MSREQCPMSSLLLEPGSHPVDPWTGEISDTPGGDQYGAKPRHKPAEREFQAACFAILPSMLTTFASQVADKSRIG